MRDAEGQRDLTRQEDSMWQSKISSRIGAAKNDGCSCPAALGSRPH